jgi:hypothetical protein
MSVLKFLEGCANNHRMFPLVHAGRDDLFDAGMHFWYVLMSSRNFSGLYCMGIHTSRADCYNPAMTIGSAADSTYEYMLKQWIMSGHTQEVSSSFDISLGMPNPAACLEELGLHMFASGSV